MKSQEIRRSFVDFFIGKGHKHLPSASLIPEGISTTLFTIAGMEPFVPVFLGVQAPPAPRAVTVQRCMRIAGGKNDLENVGRTGRHATFLEMLGNFSFGDYYKREAIAWAWEYLTRGLHIPAERLSVSVYVDDEEAAGLWKTEVGLPEQRISRLREGNFWDMGPTGPCGPCSEIFYDLGPQAGCGRLECRAGCEHCDRHIELWNLVFQQFDRDPAGELHPLPKQCIDTGMGLERLCMVLAGVGSIFETDLYEDIIGVLPVAESPLGESDRMVHMRIIADHARSATAMVADGVVPGNTDRGYVLRFITRRAVRSGKLLGYQGAFFSQLVPAVVDTLRQGYPGLEQARESIISVLAGEEKQFAQTLARGESRLQSLLAAARRGGETVLAGHSVFELHDTYGFPAELTQEIAAEARMTVDIKGYQDAMQAQRQRARRDAQSKRADVRVAAGDVPDTEFTGYQVLASQARVLALFDPSGAQLPVLEAGQSGTVVLDRTPFYAERGGQMGDRGVLARESSAFDVTNTFYRDKTHRHIMHAGVLRAGSLAAGDVIDAIVDPAWRREIRRHHTATHLLQRALKDVVSEAVAQRGSAVFPDRTRFDFDSPAGALNKEQRSQITSRVNELIRDDHHGSIRVMPFAEAIESGAVYMKGEDYGDTVRVVKFGPSIELCGGTHVESTGEIGHFVLLSESAIGASIRRVDALVSGSADAYVARMRSAIEDAGAALAARPDQVPEAAMRLARERRAFEKRIAGLEQELAISRASDYLAQVKEVDGLRYLAAKVDESAVGLRELADSIRQRFQGGVLALAGLRDGQVKMAVMAGSDAVERGVSAREILSAMAAHVDGKGGGSVALAQGAGKNPAGIDAALRSVADTIARSLDARQAR